MLAERVDGVLVREPAVDGADADTGTVGDLVQGDAEAVLGKRLVSRIEDQAAVARGVASERARCLHWPPKNHTVGENGETISDFRLGGVLWLIVRS